MELKMKYHYTYFIYPFVVKENKYQKYLLSLIRNPRFSLRIFEKQKDITLYQYFLPKMSQFLFSSFSFTKDKLDKLKDLPKDTVSAILAKYPCTIFEYDLNRDVQGKTDEGGIFFKIQKLQIICFNSGICFLCMKTNIEDSDNFSDLLNFNYKFRDIKQKGKRLNSYDKIHLQTDSFDDISNLNNFIEEFTGSPVEAMKLDIDMDRFLTYSYVCIDSQNWDAQNDFEKISYQFVKFTNFLPADNSVEYEEKEPISFTKWKYAKFGISKQGVVLFTSDASMNNYTVLPNDFETVYLYTYILNLYKKLYLKKLEYDFQNISKAKNARKKFVDFTKNLWIQEITEDEVGSVLNYNISKILQINKVYQKIKNQYDILYKEYHVESNTKMLMVFSVILIVLLIFNILNYFAMF